MAKQNTKNKNLMMFIFIIVLVIIILVLSAFGLRNYSIKKLNIEKTNVIGNIQKNINENIQKTIDENPIVVDKTIEVKNDKNNEIVNESEPANEPANKPINESTNKDVQFGSNVAFIGNSRTQAFLAYTGLKNVVDYTNVGLMVNTAITKKFVTNNKGEKITILEDLKTKNIDRIYIMLGINELGWVYSNIFIQKYEELIDKIKEVKPNCEIIIQSIIPVTKTKSDKDKVYNNSKIKEYNDLIKQMANRKQIKFIDLTPNLVDQNGNLPEKASVDGIHLNKEYCLKWLECLKNN